jgi:hypothetical protein
MIRIYSDASLSPYKNYKIASWCSIVCFEENRKIVLCGRYIVKDTNINEMELKAQEKGILFALKVLEAKPRDLKIFIDNTAAYKALTERKDLSEAEIVFIGGKENRKSLKEIENLEFYQYCHTISGGIITTTINKIKKTKKIEELKEERVGLLKEMTKTEMKEFVENVILPATKEKIKKSPGECIKRIFQENSQKKSSEDQKKIYERIQEIMEETAEEYMIKNKIIAFIRKSEKIENQKDVLFTPKSVVQNLKQKRIKNFKKEIEEHLSSHLLKTIAIIKN